MRALTANEITILKSRFQAGAQGHSQRILATGRLPVGGADSDVTQPQMPWVVQMPNGQAGILFSANPNDPASPGRRVYFLKYDSQTTGTVSEVFAYGGYAFGLVVWNGALLAVCRRSDDVLRYKVSGDSGATWSAEASLGPTVTLQKAEAAGKGPTFQLTTNKAGTKLFLFWLDGTPFPANVLWRETVNADPSTGWTAEADTLATVPSIGRNYGGTSANNQGFQRGFVMCETETANTWAMACESDDGDWHANHMCATGTLGAGGFTRRLNTGYGGGLSGGQGANGGVFLDNAGELFFYVMDDGGSDVSLWRSTDSGLTWGAAVQVMPAGTVYGEGMGGGCGRFITGYSSPNYIWGGCGTFTGNRQAMGVADLSALPNWTRILGVGVTPNFGAFEDDTVDLSARVRAISLQKDTDMDAASFNVELQNTDGALNPADPTAALYPYIKPNARFQIEQWHGVVANATRTFTGFVSQVQASSNGQTITVVGLDRSKKLLKQDVDVTAPQELDQPGYVRDMGNYVYINKTVTEVLDDLLRKAFLVPAVDAVWWPSTYVFKELKFQSGSLMAAAKKAATAAGLRFWADEDGIFRTAPLIGGGLASSWTFRAREDVLTLDTELDDDDTYTRVRIIGRANIGAKYLQEILLWPGLGQPKGCDYDPLTGDLWYLDGNGSLYRLDPEANMAIVFGPLALGLTNLDGISVDPLDDHVWISHNATYRKVSRTTGATLLGPFGAPDGNRCGIYAWNNGGTTQLRMVTRTSSKIVVMSAAGAEISRVDSPVANPTAITGDSGGGDFITGLNAVDFYQVDHAGNLINTIKQAAQNGADMGIIDRPVGVYDYGDLYQIFEANNTIVKYAVVGTPTNIEQSTIAEAVNVSMEIEIGEIRRLTVVDLNITDRAMAETTAAALLREASRLRLKLTEGAVGHPGLQINDRVTMVSPADGISADFVVRSIRSDQTADDGTYLMVVILEPYHEPGS